jgi:hypothetical protein
MTKLVADGASDGATQAYPWLYSLTFREEVFSETTDNF